MNLSFGFPEFSPETALARRTGVEAAVDRFRQWRTQTNSPVREIRRQPARPAICQPMPESIDPRLQREAVVAGERLLQRPELAGQRPRAAMQRPQVLLQPLAPQRPRGGAGHANLAADPLQPAL